MERNEQSQWKDLLKGFILLHGGVLTEGELTFNCSVNQVSFREIHLNAVKVPITPLDSDVAHSRFWSLNRQPSDSPAITINCFGFRVRVLNEDKLSANDSKDANNFSSSQFRVLPIWVIYHHAGINSCRVRPLCKVYIVSRMTLWLFFATNMQNKNLIESLRGANCGTESFKSLNYITTFTYQHHREFHCRRKTTAFCYSFPDFLLP